MVDAQFQERPLYSLAPLKKRLLIPHFFTFLGLGTIFYLGVLLNLYLLSLFQKTESLIRMITLIFLILLFLITTGYTTLRSRQSYSFYRQYLTRGKKQLFYREITAIRRQENFWDKIFQTYSLKLNEKWTFSAIPQEIDLQSYLEQLSQSRQ